VARSYLTQKAKAQQAFNCPHSKSEYRLLGFDHCLPVLKVCSLTPGIEIEGKPS
jgi:hypothetical protein